jgi:hypothetical protein
LTTTRRFRNARAISQPTTLLSTLPTLSCSTSKLNAHIPHDNVVNDTKVRNDVVDKVAASRSVKTNPVAKTNLKRLEKNITNNMVLKNMKAKLAVSEVATDAVDSVAVNDEEAHVKVVNTNTSNTNKALLKFSTSSRVRMAITKVKLVMKPKATVKFKVKAKKVMVDVVATVEEVSEVVEDPAVAVHATMKVVRVRSAQNVRRESSVVVTDEAATVEVDHTLKAVRVRKVVRDHTMRREKVVAHTERAVRVVMAVMVDMVVTTNIVAVREIHPSDHLTWTSQPSIKGKP